MRRATTLLEMIVVGVLLMGLVSTISTFFAYMPRWFAHTSLRLDVNREENVATSYLDRDINRAAECSCPNGSELQISQTAGAGATINYYLAANPNVPNTFDLRRSVDNKITYMTVARELKSLTCTDLAAYKGVDLCMLWQRDSANRRAALQWRKAVPRTADVALGDWNQDGKDETASVRVGAASVAITENQPEGTLTVTRTAALNAGSEPMAIVAGDFDRNARQDLAVLTEKDIQILEGLGNFTFTVTNTIPLASSSYSPLGLATADLDRDGRLDLVAADRAGQRLWVMYGKGNFGFVDAQQWPQSPTTLGGLPRRVRFADVNRDGILDVIVGLTNPTGPCIAIGIGNGNRTTMFDAPIFYSAGAESWDLTLGDVNRDGFLDLVSADTKSDKFYRGLGQSTPPYFGTATATTSTSPTAVRFLTASDTTGTAGVVDLAVLSDVRNTSGSLSIWQGQAGGTLGPTLTATTFTSTELDPIALATGNVTRNSYDSCVAAYQTPGPGLKTMLSTFQQTSGQLPTQDDQITSVNNTPLGVCAGDWNRDGYPDLAFARNANASRFVAVYLHNKSAAKPFFTDAATNTVNSVSRNTRIVTADFNRDGIPDLVTSQANDNFIGFMKGVGDGSFVSATQFASGTGPTGVCVGDFDRDGIPDVVVCNSNAKLMFMHCDGNATPTFNNTTTANEPVTGTTPVFCCAGDFNRDGKLDVAVVCSAQAKASNIDIFLGNGNGTFQSAITASSGGSAAAPAPVYIDTADFNRDGKLDLVIANSAGVAATGPEITVLLGNGNGTFGTATVYPFPVITGTTPGAWCARAADMNHDGCPDIVVGCYSAGGTVDSKVGVYLNRGNGTFGTALMWDTVNANNDNPTDVAISDFDRNGKLDAIFCCRGSSDGQMRLGN